MSGFSVFGWVVCGAMALGGSVLVGACSDGAQDDQDSAANGINCDVKLDRLTVDKLVGISISEPTRVAITAKEKARHLNELNLLAPELLAVFVDQRIPVYLTGGSVTNFAEWASLRGQVPRGWEGTGYTWDKVPGTGTEDGLFLGDSAKPNNAASLSIHEGTHSIDRALDFSTRSTKLNELYRQELARPVVSADANARYRRSNIEEFLAVAVDEYYCSSKTRATLLARYPSMYAYVKTTFATEVKSLNAP